jgi:type II secretory pathway pseudopilin PulG
MNFSIHPVRRSSGLTLVELLIVIAVAVVLLAVAIPLAKQPLEQQKVREASRQLNAIIAAAQARATELNRPVGILLEPRGVVGSANAVDNAAVNATEGITRIHFAEVPPLYGGDVSGALATITGGPVPRTAFANFDARAATGVRALIHTGDHIRFNYRGYWYRTLLEPEPINPNSVRVLIDVPLGAPALPLGVGIPFQIKRRPQKSIRPPIDLPDDTVIDLVGSGVGNATMDFGVWFDSVNNVWQRQGFDGILIMFQPSGAVDQVFYGSGNAVRPTGPIHLLVGRTDQVLPNTPFNATADDVANLRDPESLWVTVGHTTGRVATTDNLPLDDFIFDATSSFNSAQQQIMFARTFAMNSQSKGGR